MIDRKLFVVGIGGTTRPESSSEKILRSCLDLFAEAGAQTALFSGRSLIFPMYETAAVTKSAAAARMIDAIRACDAVIISSPGYHGTISGLLKNALDYLEELRDDDRPYLQGRPVGCIACANGWQAAMSTLISLRSVTHALRGWPTPMGAAINTTPGLLTQNQADIDKKVMHQLSTIREQVMEFTQGS